MFVRGILKSPTAQESICGKLNTEITNWEEIYTLTRKITIDSFSRILLYKILNSILYVNKSLYRMKFLDSPLCCLCNAEDETIIHLISKCLVTINLWRNIQSWANSVGLSLPDLDSKNLFLGFIGSAKPMIIENFLLLIFKTFICQKKNITSSVNFMHFKAEMKTIYQIEYKIAMQNGMLHRHFSKWEPLAPLL